MMKSLEHSSFYCTINVEVIGILVFFVKKAKAFSLGVDKVDLSTIRGFLGLKRLVLFIETRILSNFFQENKL